jgi:hypothetical protein
MIAVDHTQVQAAQSLVGVQLEAERRERIRQRRIASRPWQVRAYWTKKHLPAGKTDKDTAYDATVTGDKNLDEVMRRLEGDIRYGRIVVASL